MTYRFHPQLLEVILKNKLRRNRKAKQQNKKGCHLKVTAFLFFF